MTAKSSPALFRCAQCGGRTPVEMAVEHEGASHVVARCMTSLGPVGVAMMSYLALHRPPQRFLTWEKVERVLTDLLDVYDAGVLVRDRQRHTLSDDMWLAALGAVRDAMPTLSLPLDGHGYLYAILANLSQKAARTAELERAARLRGETPIGYSAAHAPAVLPPPTQPVPDPAAAAPAVPMPDYVRVKLAAFGKSLKAPALVATAPAPDACVGIPPRTIKPERTVPTLASIDGREQLVEVIARKGRKVTVRLLEAAAGHENTIVIDAKDLR